MFLRILVHGLLHRWPRKLLAVAAVWGGATLVVGLLTLGLDVGDKVSREFTAYGANLRLEAAEATVPVRVGGYELAPAVGTPTLDVVHLDHLKSIFWRNNVLDFVPRLEARGRVAGRDVPLVGLGFRHTVPVAGAEPVVTGARRVYRHWEVSGRWPVGDDECLVGRDIAGSLDLAPGDGVEVSLDGRCRTLRVSGLVDTGGGEDRAILPAIGVVQDLAGLPRAFAAADVVALTTPENELARRYREDPGALDSEEVERWVCTPYPESVAQDIQQAVPGSAVRVVRRVTESQGVVLHRLGGLLLLLGLLTVAACSLSVAGVLASAVRERRPEMALMVALGALRGHILRVHLAEAAVLGLAGGGLAVATGSALGAWLGEAVFGTRAGFQDAAALYGPLLGVLLALAATAGPVWLSSKGSTAAVLRSR